MNFKKLFLGSLTFALLFTSCKKTGDFTTDKDTYAQGDIITVTNTTQKSSEFYKWDFGGVEVVAENPIYELPENTPVGTFAISVLPVNNLNTTDNWKRGSRSVTITEAEKAKVIFFLPKSYFSSGSSVNETCTITMTSTGTSKTISIDPDFPSCSSNNNLSAATFENLPSGEYTFNLDGNSTTGSYGISNYSVTLDDGFDCRLIDISEI